MNKAEQLATALLEDVYSKSSTQINLPENLADLFLKWGKLNIPDKNLYYDEDGSKGRETESHCTVKYGLLDAKPSKTFMEIIHQTVPFTVRLGRVSLFENDEFDVVKVDVESKGLKTLNAAITAQCDCAPDKFKGYHPHVTLAYTKKGTCHDLKGKNIFELAENVKAEFEARELIYSEAGDSEDPDRKRKIIQFNYLKKESLEGESPKAFLKRKGLPVSSRQRRFDQLAIGDYFQCLPGKSFTIYCKVSSHAARIAHNYELIGFSPDTGIFIWPGIVAPGAPVAEGETPKQYLSRTRAPTFKEGDEVRLLKTHIPKRPIGTRGVVDRVLKSEGKPFYRVIVPDGIILVDKEEIELAPTAQLEGESPKAFLKRRNIRSHAAFSKGDYVEVNVPDDVYNERIGRVMDVVATNDGKACYWVDVGDNECEPYGFDELILHKAARVESEESPKAFLKRTMPPREQKLIGARVRVKFDGQLGRITKFDPDADAGVHGPTYGPSWWVDTDDGNGVSCVRGDFDIVNEAVGPFAQLDFPADASDLAAKKLGYAKPVKPFKARALL